MKDNKILKILHLNDKYFFLDFKARKHRKHNQDQNKEDLRYSEIFLQKIDRCIT